MDDLDHSIQIAEYDWTCFCEESEECALLKPSLACPDSDSEDSESSSPAQLNRSRTGGEQDEKTSMQLDSDVCSVCSAGNILDTAEVQAKAAEETKATANSTGLSNRLKKEVRRLETEVDNSRNGADSSFFDQTEVNGNEPHATETALSGGKAGAEKERWFVTVSDRPVRQQAAASSVTQNPPGQIRSSKQEKCVEKMKDANDSEGGRDARGFVQLKRTLVPQSGDAKTNHELRRMCSKDETMTEVPLITNSPVEHVAGPTMGGNTHQPGSVSHDAFGLDELDLCSIHSLSAAESAEEPLYRQQSLLSATSHPPNTDDAQDRGRCYCQSSLSCDAPAAGCEGHGGTGAEPGPAFPSADHGASEVPDDDSTCDEDTRSTELCVSPGPPTLQHQQIHLPASGGSSGRQPSPDLNGTPCSEAAGLTGPVYAVSAFWDEMEKLTINDILRLRTGRTAPRDPTQDTVTPAARGLPVNRTFLADGVECNSSDGPTDTSDTADSDYFTQPDESKPERSSCEFSTSDLEEEYWHFTGASRNPSPDPLDSHHPRTGGSPFLSHGELWCPWSPVPSDDRAGQRLDHRESRASMTKTTTEQNVQAPNTEELPPRSSPFLSPSPALEPLTPAPVLSSTDRHYQISIPELFEYFFTEDEAESDTCGTAYDPEDISATPVLSALHDFQTPIPSFPSSHPTARKLTFPKPKHLFLNALSEDGDVSPVRVLPPPFTQADDSTAGGSRIWQTLLSIKRICFHSKGSTWCRRSGAWVSPVDGEKASKKRKDPPSTAVAEGRERWRIWETLHTRHEGVLSALKQSDMCLVCIAFASWVLRSSNPEAADAWKAALLANLSALSAIRFLRQYVKKTPLQDDP